MEGFLDHLDTHKSQWFNGESPKKHSEIDGLLILKNENCWLVAGSSESKKTSILKVSTGIHRYPPMFASEKTIVFMLKKTLKITTVGNDRYSYLHHRYPGP